MGFAVSLRRYPPKNSHTLGYMWCAPCIDKPVSARVRLPGSKSITNRALVLAALADGPATITGALRSRDTNLMIAGLRRLGADITGDDTHIRVTPGPLGTASVDCGLAGTVMRFLPPVAALADGPVVFDGDHRARQRPMGPMLNALVELGARVDGTALPFTVHGHDGPTGGSVRIDASESSQFVSGLLLSAARFDRGVTLLHTGTALPSQPHVDMTITMLTRAGVTVTTPEPAVWQVAAGPILPVDWSVEPDLSNAAPFLAAAAVTGGSVRIPGWPADTTQAGDRFREILAGMGADVTLSDSTLTVQGTRRTHGIDIDLHDVGELTPTVAAVAALSDSPSRLYGIGHLRGHETDRLAALSTEINGLGGCCRETDDGLTVEPAPLHGGRWHAYADHRMATAGAVIGLQVPGVIVDDIETTAKTLPNFAELWDRMLADTGR